MPPVIGMYIVRGNILPGELSRLYGGQHRVPVADHGQPITETQQCIIDLGAGTVLLGGEQQQQRRLIFIQKDTAQQVVIADFEKLIVAVVDGKLHDHKIRLLLQQILLHPVHAQVGTGAADACVHIFHLAVGKSFLPPVPHMAGVGSLGPIAGAVSLGDGASDDAHGDILPRPGPAHHGGQPGQISFPEGHGPLIHLLRHIVRGQGNRGGGRLRDLRLGPARILLFFGGSAARQHNHRTENQE